MNCVFIEGKSWNFSNRIMERLVRSVYDIAEDFSADSTVDEKEEKEKDGQVNISMSVYVTMDFIFNTKLISVMMMLTICIKACNSLLSVFLPLTCS